MENKNWYIYLHHKPCGETFYVGIGQTKNFARARAKGKTHRSKFWHGVMEKYKTFTVEIINTRLTEVNAKKLEIQLIDFYGRRIAKTGPLVNITEGGDGALGYIQSEEVKKNHSQLMTGMLKGKDSPVALAVIDTLTLKTYPCIREAAEDYGIVYGTLVSMLLGINPNKTSIIYLKDYIPGTVIKRQKFRKVEKIVDTASGIIYKSKREVEKLMGIKRALLAKYLDEKLINTTTLQYLK